MRANVRVWMTIGVLSAATGIAAQNQQPPGHPIGTVTTKGELIVLELDAGAIAPANLFDLARRTLRFTPDGNGYRVENVAVQWDADFGTQITSPIVPLRNFTFPFSGKSWDAIAVGQTGTISFGVAPSSAPGGRGGPGPAVGRFAELREAAGTIVNTLPAISVFLKPRVSGPRFVKELADKVVVTWTLTESYAGVFDFSWVPTVNRFQAVLHKNGAIDLSYDQLSSQDAIVGLYPMVQSGTEQPLADLADPDDPAAPAHLDIHSVKASVVDGLFLKIALETRGPVLADGDPQLAGVVYRVSMNRAQRAPAADPDLVWTIRGTTQGRGGGGSPRYVTAGPGLLPGSKAAGNTLSVMGTLPALFKTDESIVVSVETTATGPSAAPADTVAAQSVKLSGIRSPEVDLSTLGKGDGPFTIVYEAFHHAGLPRPADMACSVIKTLGDRFDFLAWYSDFRVDNQEAGTPSTGPMDQSVTGFRPAGSSVGGSGRGPGSFCSDGRLQSTFIQPVYIGSNQGLERSPDGSMTGYNLAMSQIGHELGHRWMAFANATVNGETFPLGPTHWARGLQAPAAYPYRRPVEASAMGGGVWQQNDDGTYTQLDDDFYVPANGYSYLDLYFMGLVPASEVPDFFILRNLVLAGKDPKGLAIYRGERTKITIQDVIAANGPRTPSYETSQKQFNTGIVIVVLKGKAPSPELVERANGIRQTWIDYWAKTTGGRSTMTTKPKE